CRYHHHSIAIGCAQTGAGLRQIADAGGAGCGRVARAADRDRLPWRRRPGADAGWRFLDPTHTAKRASMSKTILTIDDSASIRQMVVMTLSAAGLDVIEAINGADGYAKATSQTVHAIITDLNMPVMN